MNRQIEWRGGWVDGWWRDGRTDTDKWANATARWIKWLDEYAVKSWVVNVHGTVSLGHWLYNFPGGPRHKDLRVCLPLGGYFSHRSNDRASLLFAFFFAAHLWFLRLSEISFFLHHERMLSVFEASVERRSNDVFHIYHYMHNILLELNWRYVSPNML